ncbi:MAG: tRNA uridine-5-carboxymethylaminomethyl(34) synthesis enzyme MnmG [Chitinispirillaceae bacterium]
MKYDIVVVGGGHAGVEAAYIAARKNMRVMLVTTHLDLIGQMSCNPAVGGIAKGNIVREIDALGGVMARLIDKAGIHFRMLNKSKGSAVWGPRAQADKLLYRKYSREILEESDNISLMQGMVVDLGVSGECISSVTLDSGEVVHTKAVIIAAGTFLNGKVHIGLTSFPAGRTGEPPATGLTERLEEFGITSGRLKTGTPARIDGRTVDFEQLTAQYGDENPWPFSYFTSGKLENKTICWSCKTTSLTHKYILDNLDRSPLYTGKINSLGPRYCPSIEDKVVRFGERDGHTLFLEPESLDHHEMYLNGLSTSLPHDVQDKMVRSIKGLENARILRPGYGIEYDFFQPLQLKSTLESKKISNLFFAGQVNGTSGYEEAACQGLVAGMNAVQNILGEEQVVLGRDSSYIGVLIDDLVTRGTDEPYRMFTSRAEYRLLLRQDNSDERLMPLANKLGFLPKEKFEQRQRVWERKKEVVNRLYSVKVSPEKWLKITGKRISQTERAGDLLKRPQFKLQDLVGSLDDFKDLDRYLLLGIESDVKYEGFVRKQKKEIAKLKKLEETIIPKMIEFEKIPGLLSESRQKLKKIKPHTLGQASRIAGVTPADISVLAIYISRYRISDSFHVKQQDRL